MERRRGLARRTLALLMALLCLMGTCGVALAEQPLTLTAKAVSVSMQPGEQGTVQYEVTGPNAATAKVTFKSSNKKIATVVKSTGLVTARRPGKANIYLYVNGKKKDKVVLTVAYKNDGAKRFFYAIGNENYEKATKLPTARKAVQKMDSLFAKASFAGTPVERHVEYNLTGKGIMDFLVRMTQNTSITENDITYFVFSGHGIESNTQNWRGALSGTDSNFVTVDMVQYCLDQVPGQVVVILGSCLSGQYIESKSLGGAAGADPETFNRSVIGAFGGSRASNYTTKALTDSVVRGKYKILTACLPLEDGHYFWKKSPAKDGFDLFFKYVAAGMSGSADTSKDKRVSLQELYKYTDKKVGAYMRKWNRSHKKKFSQHVMVWPENDPFFVYAKD